MIAPTKEEAAKADYGSFPDNYKEIVSAWIDDNLVDPYSVRDLKIVSPEKYWTQDAPIMGGKTTFGYRVQFSLNAKNRMGGYGGKTIFNILIRNGVVVKDWKEGEL